MTMVIGLKTGKEYVVEDMCFNRYTADGKILHVFFTPGKDRMITVEHENIEFFDELATEERMNMLLEDAKKQPAKAAIGVEYA